MTIEGESRMATSVPSYTTASRYCQPVSDSPAPSPGPSSTVRAWCRGHSPPPGKPDSVRQLVAGVGKLLGEASGRPVLHPQVHPVCSTAASGSVPTGAPSFTLGRRRTASPPAGSTDGSERPFHDPRERRPSMMPAIRARPHPGPSSRGNGRLDPARTPAPRGDAAQPPGQPWW